MGSQFHANPRPLRELARQLSELANQMAGVGQTWEDMTALRSGQTIYQNTSSRPISVLIEDNTNERLELSTNGVLFEGLPTVNAYQPGGLLVPPGTYYRWSGPTPFVWWELR